MQAEARAARAVGSVLRDVKALQHLGQLDGVSGEGEWKMGQQPHRQSNMRRGLEEAGRQGGRSRAYWVCRWKARCGQRGDSCRASPAQPASALESVPGAVQAMVANKLSGTSSLAGWMGASGCIHANPSSSRIR